MVKNSKKKVALVKAARHGPVSTISTAPVAIGNSIMGSKAKVINAADGVRVVGRDFAFALQATAATITGWEFIGGMPVTPAVMPSSVLRSYTQMYSAFKVNSVVVHYITSSPTSQAGDVLFYYERDRNQPHPDYSSSSFLPYILSDSHTMIGPQWTNHSMLIKPPPDWKTTNYGMNTDINEDACGAIRFFSKTNAVNSPGYILIDYDISFSQLAVNPRAGVLPIARGQSSVVSIGGGPSAVTAGTTGFISLGVTGNGLNNATTSMPAGATTGDVYRVVINATASTTNNTFTNCTLSNLIVATGAKDVPITIDDGFTCYAAYIDTTVGGGNTPLFSFYPTLSAALTNTQPFLYGVTATVTFALVCTIELVGNVGAGTYLQSSY